MGYYTRHELEVVEGNRALIATFIEECEEAAYAITDTGESYDSCKWYSHEQDLREFSKKHPEALFKLGGEGEESGDIWAEYYRAGKMQVCKAAIVIPDFNPELLS